MTKAKTYVLLLAVVGLCAGSALGQAAKTTIFEVAYGLGPAAHNGTDAPKDNSINAEPGEEHCNQGAMTWTRALKAYPHTYIADWDTAPMIADVDVGGQLTGWGSYTPNYYMAIRPVGGQTPPATPQFPDPATPAIVNISSIWSENDWHEGDGTSYMNYNWSNLMGEWASTAWYAGDHAVMGAEIPWTFPGGGTGPSAPYPRFVDCTFVETFHTNGDLGGNWSPWTGEPKTPTNSQSFSLSLDNFYIDDNGTPADPLDDFYVGMYAEVQIDQALMDDMFNNVYNRGVALWEWTNWDNGVIYSADQNPSSWPYIYARIEACSGDANLDKAVDGLDYVSWSNNYQAAGMGWSGGDFNNDGVTDGLDYVIWSNTYQQSCPGAPGAVPEPATMALLAISGLALLKRRR